ncbi:MAG TPA: cupin domain-containing protein [Vicinamibacterales bacterium]
MRKSMSWITAAAILSGGAAIGAREMQHPAVAQLKDAQWGPAPAMLPPGAQIAVLSGDPGKAGPYTVRLKFPANYVIPAHSHPTDENVAVLSGTFMLGMGDKLDKKAAGNATLTVGGYALAPSGMNHYAYTGAQAATILLYGVGPVEFKYVNPSDDPRTKKTQ